MIVYIVIISDTENEFFRIHAVFSKEQDAIDAQKELESSLDEDMVVLVEQHEVIE
jgi:hypothetical protein